ncbi:MAG: hypothetical protein M9884_00110 [Rhodocyclaceae bacterium]|jgi:hypothetical protein|nr:hypothetical protein [Rhodocyclaceae bacterium]
MRTAKRGAIVTVVALGLGLSGAAWSQAPSKADMQRGAEIMQKQMSMMTPELVEKAKALSPEIKQFLVKIALKHSRHSDTLTLRQVMTEILADYQAIGAAIATDNGELASDAARRLANHRLPRGGMLPYLPLEKVTTKDLSLLPAMENIIEVGAIRLAEAAEKGDMGKAAQEFGAITGGCVTCHAHFRGQPGTSERLKK